MKVSLIKAALIMIILFPLPCVGYADGALQYELTRGKVEKAWIIETPGGYSVDVKLKEPYIREFEELTRYNMGRRLKVILSGQILTDAMLKIPFPWGIIISTRKWSSEEEARKFIETVLPGIEIKGPIEGIIPEGERCPQPTEAVITVIEDFADWLVTRGIAGYYRDGDLEEIRDYGGEREVSISVYSSRAGGGASSYSFFAVDEREVLLSISTECYLGGGILLNRIRHDDKLYELWYIGLECMPCVYRPEINKHIVRFYAVETGRLAEERKIIARGDKFFYEFSLKEGTKIKFPYISLYQLYLLGPDLLPQGVKGTILEKLTVKDVVKSHRKTNSKEIEEVDEDIRNRIYDYTRWLITKGAATYYKDKDIGELREQLLRKKGAKLSKASEFTYIYILGFSVWPRESDSGVIDCSKAAPEIKVFQNSIKLIDRIEYENKLYEFWSVFIGEIKPCQKETKSESQPFSMRFFAAETEGLTGDRKIILESDRYFREFSLPDGAKLSFPPVKIFSIDELIPSYKVEAFKGTELEGIHIDDLVKLP